MPIQVLPHEVAARIAAGEVVERPASAVKELVENALDAGATVVRVEAEEGGVDALRVVDNGHGIPAAEAPALFQRHATSKLTDADDLLRIDTLGFRGEALYSLAAVARVSIVSRTPQSDAAVYVEAEGGRLRRHEPRGGPVGTAVTVEGLFAETPARRRFLRSARAELGRIHQVVSTYALAYPEVRFTLDAGGRTAFASPGNGDLREAAAAVFGRELAEAFLPLPPAEGEGIGVTGIVSPPGATRANRSGITLFVNRRPVQYRALTYAVTEAYHGLTPGDRFPIAVLLIAVPPADVDVNVHPAKSEVRFRREGEVFSAVQRAVRETVVAAAPVPALKVDGGGTPGGAGLVTAFPRVPEGAADAAAPAPDGVRHPAVAAQGEGQPPLPLSEALPTLRVLGQSQETYIIAEGPDGLYLIDQHAAHECVVYERLRDAAQHGTPEMQGLLEPVTVHLAAGQEETVHDQPELLAQYGWQLEPFGGGALLLRAVPSALAGRDPARAFLDLLDTAAAAAEFATWEDRIAATLACHGSVRAGQTLSMEEMARMVRLLESARQPHTCPHGRPTMLHLSAYNLEREFGRR